MLWLKLPWAPPGWEKLDFGMGQVPSKVCWSMMSRLCTSTSSPKDVSCGAVLLENSLLVLTLLDKAWETGKSVTSQCYSGYPHSLRQPVRGKRDERTGGARNELRDTLPAPAGLSDGVNLSLRRAVASRAGSLGKGKPWRPHRSLYGMWKEQHPKIKGIRWNSGCASPSERCHHPIPPQPRNWTGLTALEAKETWMRNSDPHSIGMTQAGSSPGCWHWV